MATATINKIERAHQMYRDGCHEEALVLYTEALTIAKTKTQRIALHSNRAACHLKLHDFRKAAEECTSVLELDQNHTGALMLRAQTLVTLKDYQSALFDVNRLIELSPSSEAYQNLHARLKTQLSLAPIPESDEEVFIEELEEGEETDVDGDDDVNNQEFRFETEGLKKGLKDVFPAQNINPPVASVKLNKKEPFVLQTEGWKEISRPVGHSRLDYSRWDKVEDGDSSEGKKKWMSHNLNINSELKL